MFTMILLVYLQSGLTVNLIGSTVSGEFPDLPACRAATGQAIHTLPIPQGYDAAWQDATCVPINRNVKVGNERLTALDKALFTALEPQPCAAPAVCRPAETAPGPPKPRKRKSSGKIGDKGH